MNFARPYVPADRDACLALFDTNVPRFFDASEKADFEEFLDRYDGPYRVIERDGRIVACGGHFVSSDGKTAGLCWGVVDGRLHGQGVGTVLTEARLAAIRADPAIETVRLDTGPRTKGFYERFGFAVDGHVPDGYAPGYDRYDMVLRL